LKHFSSLSCILALVLCCHAAAAPLETKPALAKPVSAQTAHAKPCPRCAPLGILFVVNGSNDDYTISESMDLIVSYKKLPLQVETIAWCRYGKATWDHADYEAQMAGAKNLAVMIQTYRAQCPHSDIYLLGHSAGCHVVLEAAAKQPPDTLERIALMAPSVSNHYDLRPALRASRRGIANFYSMQDSIVSLGAEMLGTADRRWGKPGGETGFCPPPPNCPDAALYLKLRQYYWHEGLARTTGHLGGHRGFTRAGFLDACVLPLLFGGH
jgi:hypothetical protein